MDQFKPVAGIKAELEEIKTQEVELWLKFTEANSIIGPRNKESVLRVVAEARDRQTALPLILTFCPGIENLEQPTDRGQTRRLVPLTSDNPRLKAAIEELIAFMIFTKEALGTNPAVLLIFADRLEPDAQKMFTNANQMPQIADESLRGIRQAFFEIDQQNFGLIQESRIKIPKVRKQTQLPSGTNITEVIRNRELEMLDPSGGTFKLWLKHLSLTRGDKSFVSTGWQSIESAKAIWDRIRFMLAQCIVDGEILPRMFTVFDGKQFKEAPKSIFLASTAREAGIELEMDAFDAGSGSGVIAPFHNIGRWTDLPVNSRWISMFRERKFSQF